MKYSVHITAILLTASAAAVLMLAGISLGVPGEWGWGRHDLPTDSLGVVDRFVVPVFAGCIFYFVASRCRKNLEQATRAGVILRYLLLLAVSCFWFVQVQQTTPLTHRTLKPL